jgi:hypothetical protein
VITQSGVAVGSVKVETVPPGNLATSPLDPKLTTLFEPASVTALPPDVMVWSSITSVESPGAAEIVWPPITAIAVEVGGGGAGGSVGFAKKLVESPWLVPPIKTPDDPTETTTGLLFESVIVATEPGFAVDPFGRTTPDEPGIALIV